MIADGNCYSKVDNRKNLSLVVCIEPRQYLKNKNKSKNKKNPQKNKKSIKVNATGTGT